MEGTLMSGWYELVDRSVPQEEGAEPQLHSQTELYPPETQSLHVQAKAYNLCLCGM